MTSEPPPRTSAPSRAEGLRALRTLLAEAQRAHGAAEVPADGAAEECAEAGIGRLVARSIDRLDRDLLPRTAGAHSHLVVGIVGPNNAGKSALFNSLVGAGAVSPSRPVGGATRRLVGALHPRLREALESEPTLAGFPMRAVAPESGGVSAALLDATNPAELLLVETETLPEGLLVVDTPDFDSVLRTNRVVAESLLCVADVAIVVVTRHTYQNRDVVDFLTQWLAHARPWVLVYNEAFDAATTERHARKLASDVGTPPAAVFAAEHDPQIASGARELSPRGLAFGGAPAPPTLKEWLHEQRSAAALKERALEASLQQLQGDLHALVGLAGEESERAAARLAEIARHASSLGREAARETMPTAVFLAAFRRVLDRRPTAFQRSLRSGLRWTGEQVEGAARWIRARVSGKKDSAPREADLAALGVEAERAAIDRRWTRFHEAVIRLLRDVRDEARDVDRELHAALALDLATKGTESLARAKAAAGAEASELADFAAACEALVEAELDASGVEWALQLGVDALHLLPAFAAGAVILHTGGLGADVAVAGGGAMSSVLAERLSRLLGSGVAHEARERWASRRGEVLAEAAMTAVLPATRPILERRATDGRQLAREIDGWLRTSWRGRGTSGA